MVQSYQLRNAEHIRIERVRTSSMQRMLFYKGFQLYNKLPENVKMEKIYTLFRKNIVKFAIACYY